MPHALLNALRLGGSYIPVNDAMRMLQGDLTTQNTLTLKELARVLGIRGLTNTMKKTELVTELRRQVVHLLSAPLTHHSLIQEAQKSNIPLVGFSYRDLRMLCGYDVVKGAGIVYLQAHRTPLGAILANTEPGSHQRLSRLLRDPRVMSEWGRMYPEKGSERDIYVALFCRAVTLTPELEISPLLYTSESDPVGHLLLETLPGSVIRQEFLQDYDHVLLQEFSRRHGTTANLLTQVALHQPKTEFDVQLYYTHDRDQVLTVLATTFPNTLERYVSLAPLDISMDYFMEYSLEDLCSLPCLPDHRPHKVRDYLPHELSVLPIPILLSFCIREGLYLPGANVMQDRETVLESLHVAYFSPTFLQPSRVERTEQVHTGLHSLLNEVPPSQLYAYGIREGSGSYVYFERDELRGAFTASNSFTNPFTNESFSQQSIQRLLILSLNDTTEGADEFRTCIKTVLLRTATSNSEERLLIASLRNVPELVPSLEALFETGMYMRRWDGNLAKYPLRVQDTRSSDGESEQEENQHFDRVQASLERLQTTIDALPPHLRLKCWGLPLRNYIRSGYYSPNDPEDGKTLRDRFAIVLQGNAPDAPMASCIRLSSGWFVFTALYYYDKIFHGSLRGVLPHQVEFIS